MKATLRPTRQGMVIACPACDFASRLLVDLPDGLVKCQNCGHQFTPATAEEIAAREMVFADNPHAEELARLKDRISVLEKRTNLATIIAIVFFMVATLFFAGMLRVTFPNL